MIDSVSTEWLVCATLLFLRYERWYTHVKYISLFQPHGKRKVQQVNFSSSLVWSRLLPVRWLVFHECWSCFRGAHQAECSTREAVWSTKSSFRSMRNACQRNAADLLQTVSKPLDDALFHDAQVRICMDRPDPTAHDRSEPNRHQHALPNL